ncbi:uncharacterized protein METZ01_LOCUS220178 [marine metagenome]|uniref:Uncharacterized protein n=1 Tax=marine metagenome TaxID=408172 RepID=A0A382FY69_9ZZZZ
MTQPLTYQEEYEHDMMVEQMTDGELAAYNTQVYVTSPGYGHEDSSYWIFSPFTQTWESNPFFVPKSAADHYMIKYEHPEYNPPENSEIEFRALWIGHYEDAESGRYA